MSRPIVGIVALGIVLGALTVGRALVFGDRCEDLASGASRGPISDVVQLRDGRVVVATLGGRLFVSSGSGAGWIRRREPAPGGRMVQLSGATILAERRTASSVEGVFLSEDLGSTWRRVSCDRGSFAVDPIAPEIAYMSLQPGGAGSAEHGRIRRSANSGRTWWGAARTGGGERQAETLINAIAVSPWSHEVLAAPESGGLFRSTNGASTWRFDPVAPGGIGLDGVQLTSLAFDTGGRRIWVGTRQSGLFTQVGSEPWRTAGFRGRAAHVLATRRGSGSTLIAAVERAPAWDLIVTRDHGVHWSRVRGLPRDVRGISAGTTHDFFAWTDDRLFASDSEGATWTALRKLPR